MRVLIADDSRTSRKVLTRMLTSWGYDVIACEDGREAYEALRAPGAPKLAILDWVMPGMDGIEICRRLRREPSECPTFIYLLSARTSPEFVLQGLEAGADDYLKKPVRPEELRVRLRNGRRLVDAYRELVRTKEVLREKAMIDPLTQIWNRGAFMEVARRQLSSCQRSGESVGLLMIDLDHFKKINDTHGHPAGDAVLREVAARVRRGIRDGDQLARYGGEELIVLLGSCGARGAYVAADRIRREIARAPILVGDVPIRVTASIGAAARTRGEGLESLIQRADAALYEAKRKGRDRCVLAAPTEVLESAV